MEKRVSAFEVRRGFGQMLQDILKHGDKFVVERHGAPVAAVVPIEVYEQWKQTREPFLRRSERPRLPQTWMKIRLHGWPAKPSTNRSNKP